MAVKVYKNEELGFTLEIDHDRCDGDVECVEVCPVEVFEIVDGKSTAPRASDCIECCACVEACPKSAIKHSSC